MIGSIEGECQEYEKGIKNINDSTSVETQVRLTRVAFFVWRSLGALRSGALRSLGALGSGSPP